MGRFSRSRIGASFTLAIVLVVAMSVVGFLSASSFLSTNASVERSYKVMASVEKLRALMEDTESMVRGYIITGQPPYIDAYMAAREPIPAALGELRQLVAEEPRASERMDRLEALVTARLDRLQESLEIRRDAGLQAAIQYVMSGAGSRIMDDLRSLLGEMRADETAVLNALQAEEDRRARDTLLITALGALLACAVVASAGFVVNRDFAALRLAQERERRTAARYELMNASLTDLVTILTPDGVHLYASPASRALLGYEPEELNGRSVYEILHPDDLPEIERVRAEVLKSGGPGNVTFRIRRRDGEYIWFETISRVMNHSGNQGGGEVITVSRDITERKRSEEELRKLSLAVENSPAAVVITDRDGSIEYVNRKFSQVTGYSREEARGKNPRVLKSGDMSPELYTELWNTITSGSQWRGEFRNRKKNGDFYWASASISPISDSQGKITHFVGIQEDITLLKQTQGEVLRARDAAEAANRAKSDFLAAMSHEIRTPMNAIIGMADLLCESQLDDEQRRYVEVFRLAGENLLAIINDILDLSKVEAGQLSLEAIDFTPREVTERTCDILRLKARDKGLGINCQIAPEVPEVLSGDPGRLAQVLTNLVGNAIKFTDEGEVAVSVSPAAGESGAAPSDEGGVTLHFEVRDTGIGIPPDKLDAIFDRFTQADSSTTRKYGGTGLGLAICKQLVQMMGGRIWVESEPGRGSRFHFTARFCVPDAASASALLTPAASPESADSGTDGRPLRILVVDDSADNRLLIESYMKKTPHTLHSVEDGEQALASFTAGSYDLVLMDMQMPVMDGYAATRAIRAWEQERKVDPTPVVALTAHASREEVRKSLDAGCTAHLIKPIRKATLLEAVSRLARTEAGTAPAGPERPAGDRTVVTVDPDLEPLIPGYLSNRREDATALRQAVSAGDFERARVIGHSMKGTGGGYGFDAISEIGAAIENAARSRDGAAIEAQAASLEAYLSTVKVVFQEA